MAKIENAVFTPETGFSNLIKSGLIPPEKPKAQEAKTVTTEELGRVFLDKLTLPFEAISLLIVVSIIGAIMLALFSKGEK